jgi:hypothetical protein
LKVKYTLVMYITKVYIQFKNGKNNMKQKIKRILIQLQTAFAVDRWMDTNGKK